MKKLIFPGPVYLSKGIGFLRIVTGLLVTYHGLEVFDEKIMQGYLPWDAFKGFASPALLVYAGKIAELVGGILLTFGLLTRVACVIIAGTMAYISFFVGHGKIWYEDQHPFLLVLLAFVFFFTGPGAWSMDILLFHIRNKMKADKFQ
jgi:putative oxidoreductase